MKNNRGFSAIVLLLIIVLFAGIATAVFITVSNESDDSATLDTAQEAQPDESEELAQNSLNNQIQNDVIRLSSAMNSYAADNNGRFPDSQDQLDSLVQSYVNDQFISPLTEQPYELITINSPDEGLIAVMTGALCDGDSGGLSLSNPRSFALLTQLADGTTYCVDNDYSR